MMAGALDIFGRIEPVGPNSIYIELHSRIWIVAIATVNGAIELSLED